MTYGDLFTWRWRLYVWFRRLVHRRPLIELDLEGKKTDLFWRRLSWRIIEKGPEIAEIFFRDTPLFKYLKTSAK